MSYLTDWWNYLKVNLGFRPDTSFVARQLRKPEGFYAEKITRHMNKANQRLLELTLSQLPSGDGERWLEIGFGNGEHLSRVISARKLDCLHALDHSEEMVAVAERENTEEVSEGKLELKVGDSSGIPWPENFFDRVYCNNVIYFWNNPGLHLRELKRVLKNGGELACGFRTRSTMKNLPFTDHGFVMYEPGEWADTMRRAGFEELRQHLITETRELNPSLKFSLESVCMVGRKPPVP